MSLRVTSALAGALATFAPLWAPCMAAAADQSTRLISPSTYTFTVLARDGDRVGDATIRDFSSGIAPPGIIAAPPQITPDGTVFFVGTAQAGRKALQGIYSVSSGQARKVVQTGDAVGGGTIEEIFPPLSVSDNGQVAYLARVAGQKAAVVGTDVRLKQGQVVEACGGLINDITGIAFDKRGQLAILANNCILIGDKVVVAGTDAIGPAPPTIPANPITKLMGLGTNVSKAGGISYVVMAGGNPPQNWTCTSSQCSRLGRIPAESMPVAIDGQRMALTLGEPVQDIRVLGIPSNSAINANGEVLTPDLVVIPAGAKVPANRYEDHRQKQLRALEALLGIKVTTNLPNAAERMMREGGSSPIDQIAVGSINERGQVVFVVDWDETAPPKVPGMIGMPAKRQALILGTPTSGQLGQPLEPKEGSLALLAATTKDSRSVSVQYQIKGGALSSDAKLSVFRTDAPGMIASGTPIGKALTLTDAACSEKQRCLAEGKHEVDIPLDPAALRYHPTLKYVNVQSLHRDNKSVAYFKKYMLGVISHGFDRYQIELPCTAAPTDLLTCLGKWIVESQRSGIPEWEIALAKYLKSDNNVRYDDVIAFDWMKTCALPKPDQAVEAGHQLGRLIYQWISREVGSKTDVVDVHFIGHSRGAVVVSQAAKYLSVAYDRFGAGSIYMSLLDPHPANNNYGEWASFSDVMATMPAPYPDVNLGAIAKTVSTLFQSRAVDPPVHILASVTGVELVYQRTPANCLTGRPYSEHILNLWGMNTEDARSNLGKSPVQEFDVTSCPNAIGHNEVPAVYIEYLRRHGMNREFLFSN